MHLDSSFYLMDSCIKVLRGKVRESQSYIVPKHADRLNLWTVNKVTDEILEMNSNIPL